MAGAPLPVIVPPKRTPYRSVVWLASPLPARAKEPQRPPAASVILPVAPTRFAIPRDAPRSPATLDGSVPYRPRQTNERPPARDTWPDPAASDATATSLAGQTTWATADSGRPVLWGGCFWKALAETPSAGPTSQP